jgi:hypothetical protein
MPHVHRCRLTSHLQKSVLVSFSSPVRRNANASQRAEAIQAFENLSGCWHANRFADPPQAGLSRLILGLKKNVESLALSVIQLASQHFVSSLPGSMTAGRNKPLQFSDRRHQDPTASQLVE